MERSPLSRISNAQLKNLARLCISHSFTVEGKNTYKQEFVTCGGVLLKEINFKKMESRLLQNLFFSGEILDIDGVTGGFNFQHAWTSGWIAGLSMAGC
jgi:predicted flavoprotein YhiN